jgi:hypothetical protein
LRVRELEQENVNLSQRISGTIDDTSKIDQLERECSELVQALDHAKQRLLEADKEKFDVLALLEKQTKDLARVAEEKTSLVSRCQDHLLDLKQLQVELQQRAAREAEQRSELDFLRQVVDQRRSLATRAAEDSVEHVQKLISLQESQNAQIQEAHAKIESLQQKNHELEIGANELQSTNQTLTQNVSALAHENSRLEQLMKKLNQDKDVNRAMEEQNLELRGSIAALEAKHRQEKEHEAKSMERLSEQLTSLRQSRSVLEELIGQLSNQLSRQAKAYSNGARGAGKDQETVFDASHHLGGQLSKLTDLVSQLQDQKQEQSQEIIESNQGMLTLRNAVAELTAKNSVLTEERKRLLARLDEITERERSREFAHNMDEKQHQDLVRIQEKEFNAALALSSSQRDQISQELAATHRVVNELKEKNLALQLQCKDVERLKTLAEEFKVKQREFDNTSLTSQTRLQMLEEERSAMDEKLRDTQHQLSIAMEELKINHETLVAPHVEAVSRLRLQNEQLKEVVEELAIQLKKSKDESAPLRKDLETFTRLEKDASNSVASLLKEKTELLSKNNTLQEEVTSLLGELHSTLQSRDALVSQLKSNSSKSSSSDETTKSLTAQLLAAEQANRQLEAHAQQWQSHHTNQAQTLHDLKELVAQQEKQLFSQSESLRNEIAKRDTLLLQKEQLCLDAVEEAARLSKEKDEAATGAQNFRLQLQSFLQAREGISEREMEKLDPTVAAAVSLLRTLQQEKTALQLKLHETRLRFDKMREAGVDVKRGVGQEEEQVDLHTKRFMTSRDAQTMVLHMDSVSEAALMAAAEGMERLLHLSQSAKSKEDQARAQVDLLKQKVEALSTYDREQQKEKEKESNQSERQGRRSERHGSRDRYRSRSRGHRKNRERRDSDSDSESESTSESDSRSSRNRGRSSSRTRKRAHERDRDRSHSRRDDEDRGGHRGRDSKEDKSMAGISTTAFVADVAALDRAERKLLFLQEEYGQYREEMFKQVEELTEIARV